MKIGYPCMNNSVGCSPARTFRLKSYNEKILVEKISQNLACLYKILKFNAHHKIFFFRITSDLIPFASHPVCQFNWQEQFKDKFHDLGQFIKTHNMRISMHPDQFTLINSPRDEIFQNSIKELEYHYQVLELMELDQGAKIQIHVGGVYNDKPASIKRFIHRYHLLSDSIRSRLVIENDDKSFALKDCLIIHQATKIPILFDVFHHQLLNYGESITVALKLTSKTWQKRDTRPMIDYSSKKPGSKKGSHAETLDLDEFQHFIKAAKSFDFDFDLMLEIKDKEKSALRALEYLNKTYPLALS
jgi:UV DNA damage endonuclease